MGGLCVCCPPPHSSAINSASVWDSFLYEYFASRAPPEVTHVHNITNGAFWKSDYTLIVLLLRVKLKYILLSSFQRNSGNESKELLPDKSCIQCTFHCPLSPLTFVCVRVVSAVSVFINTEHSLLNAPHEAEHRAVCVPRARARVPGGLTCLRRGSARAPALTRGRGHAGRGEAVHGGVQEVMVRCGLWRGLSSTELTLEAGTSTSHHSPPAHSGVHEVTASSLIKDLKP